MRPPISPLEYAARWEDDDGLLRVGNHTRDDVERELWPWLKRQGLADDSDDAELRRFLDAFLVRRPAHMRPGLRFRRIWSSAETAILGSALAEAIRTEFDAVFVVAREPGLSSRQTAEPGSGEDSGPRKPSPRLRAVVREAIPERVRHEVWRRDGGRCVDCGSRERLEFDHIIPISKGGSNTARNIELRCEACNRGKGASV